MVHIKLDISFIRKPGLWECVCYNNVPWIKKKELWDYKKQKSQQKLKVKVLCVTHSQQWWLKLFFFYTDLFLYLLGTKKWNNILTQKNL